MELAELTQHKYSFHIGIIFLLSMCACDLIVFCSVLVYLVPMRIIIIYTTLHLMVKNSAKIYAELVWKAD